jgi:hypothetical protein
MADQVQVLVTLAADRNDPGGVEMKKHIRGTKPDECEYGAYVNLDDVEINIDKIQIVEDASE